MFGSWLQAKSDEKPGSRVRLGLPLHELVPGLQMFAAGWRFRFNSLTPGLGSAHAVSHGTWNAQKIFMDEVGFTMHHPGGTGFRIEMISDQMG
jgi:hypothetical protein